MEATGTGSQSDTEADGIPLVILLRHRLPARHKGCYTCFQGGYILEETSDTASRRGNGPWLFGGCIYVCRL
jgi:hypothetical protein